MDELMRTVSSLLIVFLLSGSPGMTQSEIPVMDFEEFKSHLHQDDDKVHVINFWATWCKPCVAEMPHFIELEEQTGDDQVEIILVSLDFPAQIESSLKPYLKKHNIKSKVIVLDDPDANKWIESVSENWSGAIPFTIGYKGGDRKTRNGAFDTYEDLKSFIKF